MAYSKMYFLEEEIEQRLLEKNLLIRVVLVMKVALLRPTICL
jgi:hypothetical protein